MSGQTVCFQCQVGSMSGSVIDETLDTWHIHVNFPFDFLIYDLNLFLVTSAIVRSDPLQCKHHT